MNLDGKTIVLTGATSGIGKEMARMLAPSNKVIAVGRDRSKLDELANELGVETVCADLSDSTDVEQAADLIVKRFPCVDLLINNAAVQYVPRFLDDSFSYELIQREIQINFTSICQLTYLLLPALLQGSPSIILNVNSGLGLAPKTSSAIYCGTKGALNLLSLSLGYQLEDKGIKVLQAFLPLVDTPMTQGRGTGKVTPSYAAEKIIHGIEKERSANDIGKVPILRMLLRVWPRLGLKIMKGY